MSDVQSVGSEAVELVRTIVDTHHVFMKDHMPALYDAARASVQGAQGHEPTETFGRTVGALYTDIMQHLQKEEQVLFPMIEELHGAQTMGREPNIMGCGVHGPVAQMRHEHGVVKELLDRLTTAIDLPAGDPAAPCISDDIRGQVRALRDDLFEHIRKEDDLLFPKAEALFDTVAAA